MERAPALKGSQKWLQVVINQQPEAINLPLRQATGLEPNLPIEWVSPLAADGFVKYRDGEVLRKLRISLSHPDSESFWPARGPVWDGLGRTSDGKLFLVEAKANVPELASPGTKATEPALSSIRTSLLRAREQFAPGSDADWSGTFYQYANRLAQLFLLRQLNGLDAHLVFVYFVNATDVKGPRTEAEWKGAISLAHAALGVEDHLLSNCVHDLFIDVATLASV